MLSAGGMFGAYQAGVWQEIAEVFDPDIVVGASVGALNAWLIASGCPAEALTERWLHLDAQASIQWRFPRHLHDGILDRSALESEIRRMCAASQPVRRLGIVVTHTRTLTPRLFEWPEVEWTHVAASCAVPLFLGSHRIGDQWYSDGGLLDPLPLASAIAMGATKIVTVNLLKHRPWPVRAAVLALRRWSRYNSPRTDGVSIMEVSPDSPLGPVRDSMYWSAETSARLIERGRKDAGRIKEAIVQWCVRENQEFGNIPNLSPA